MLCIAALRHKEGLIQPHALLRLEAKERSTTQATPGFARFRRVGAQITKRQGKVEPALIGHGGSQVAQPLLWQWWRRVGGNDLDLLTAQPPLGPSHIGIE